MKCAFFLCLTVAAMMLNTLGFYFMYVKTISLVHFYLIGVWQTNTYEPRHAIMCLREINYVMRYDVLKSDVIISRRA